MLMCLNESVRAGIVRASGEVQQALADGKPVLALESSVISQGLPRPRNLEAALSCEEAARRLGVVPATTAVIDGTIRVGLTEAELERMANSNGIGKAGSRDLAAAAASGQTMATTVGASITLARLAGIEVMATGGIGGVHRGYNHQMDVSHDLTALATTPCIVVCAGFKSILDLPRTLEMIETLGISLVGLETSQLPDFYSRDSGFQVPSMSVSRVAATWRVQRELGLTTAMVVANPPPEHLALEHTEMDAMVEAALAQAESKSVHGKDVTPFLLERIAQTSSGRSVELNVELLRSNVMAGARIALAIAEGAQA
jgi:pseudouridine-5'-phosphate glycosidase